MRTAIYVRISQDRTGQAAGVRRQEADCRQLAEQKGWEVVEVYRDNDVSAYNGEPRPAYRRMIEDLNAGRIKGVVAWHPDRLYRRLPDLEELVTLAEEHGVRFATVTAGDIDLSTASGRMNARILASVARGESERTGERIQRMHLQRAESGKWHGGRRPFGYDRHRGTLRIREDEAKLIKAAARRLIAGDPLYRFVREWNRSGVRTQLGNSWSVGTLRRMLTSPHLAGIRVHRRTGMRVRGDWPAILTEDQHDLLTVRLSTPGRHNGGGRPGARRYMLTGLAYCSACGKRLMGSGGRYVCAPSFGGCGATRVASRALEDYVHSWIESAELPEARGRLKDPTPNERKVLAELRRLEGKLDRLAEDYAADIIDERRFGIASRRLRDRIAEQQAALAHPVEQPRTRAPWPTLWKRYEDYERRRASGDLTTAEVQDAHDLIATYIHRVTVAPARRRGPGLDPDRVSISWQEGVRVPSSVVLGVRPAR